MTPTAHLDTFAGDHLPLRGEWPEFIYELPELQFPGRLNCAAELLDRAIEQIVDCATPFRIDGSVRHTPLSS